jgi:2-(3-amino-3-carboxypropyl)histidine synthase
MFDFEIARVIEHIVKGKYTRVLLQFPEGLKPNGFKLAREIEKATGAEIILSADACYGACDLAVDAQRTLRADIIIHYGHSPMIERSVEGVFYIEAQAIENIDHIVREALKLLREEKQIGLATVVQHVNQLDHAARILRDAGKKPYIGRAGGNVTHDGQVLGCDYSTAQKVAADVEAYIFIGGGDFHAIGIQLATGKKTIVADPYLNQTRDMTDTVKLLLKKRWAAITKFQDSKRIGIAIGLKTGQTNIVSAETVRNLLEDKGKECAFLSAREFTPETLESFTDVEAFVITACPRLAIDDQERFRRPILNTEEVLIAVGKKRWEDYGKLSPQQEAT